MPSRFMAPHAVTEPKAWTICSETDWPWAQQAGQRALTGSCVQHCPRFRDALSTGQAGSAQDRQASESGGREGRGDPRAPGAVLMWGLTPQAPSL